MRRIDEPVRYKLQTTEKPPHCDSVGLLTCLGGMINISINQSIMALSALCVGHSRTQSHAALYKIFHEVIYITSLTFTPQPTILFW